MHFALLLVGFVLYVRAQRNQKAVEYAEGSTRSFAAALDSITARRASAPPGRNDLGPQKAQGEPLQTFRIVDSALSQFPGTRRLIGVPVNETDERTVGVNDTAGDNPAELEGSCGSAVVS